MNITRNNVVQEIINKIEKDLSIYLIIIIITTTFIRSIPIGSTSDINSNTAIDLLAVNSYSHINLKGPFIAEE